MRAPAPYHQLEVEDAQQVEQQFQQPRRSSPLDVREVRPGHPSTFGELELGQSGFTARVLDGSAEVCGPADGVLHDHLPHAMCHHRNTVPERRDAAISSHCHDAKSCDNIVIVVVVSQAVVRGTR